MKIINKNIKELYKFTKDQGEILLHPLSSFCTQFTVIKKRKTIQIKIELPIDQISSNGQDLRDILSFRVDKKSDLPVIPMLVVFSNKEPVIRKGK